MSSAATEVAAAVDAGLGLLPMAPTCLRRSMTLLRELARLDLAAALHVGVRHQQARIEAHAWVQVDTYRGERRSDGHPRLRGASGRGSRAARAAPPVSFTAAIAAGAAADDVEARHRGRAQVAIVRHADLLVVHPTSSRWVTTCEQDDVLVVLDGACTTCPSRNGHSLGSSSSGIGRWAISWPPGCWVTSSSSSSIAPRGRSWWRAIRWESGRGT